MQNEVEDQKISRCRSQYLFGEVSFSITEKTHKEIIRRTPELKTSMQRLTRNAGNRKYRPTFVIELSDHDMSTPQQAHATLKYIFPALVSRHDATFTDGCVIYLNARSQNVCVCSK